MEKKIKLDVIQADAVVDANGVAEKGVNKEIRGQTQLQFLPELVLEIIIKMLEDPNDVRHLLEAFPLIDQVTGASKSLKLMFDKVFPVIFSHLSKKDILKCRQVCRWWKKSVDNFLEGHPSQYPCDHKAFSKLVTGYRQYCDLESKNLEAVVIRYPIGFFNKIHYARKKKLSGSLVPSFVGKSVVFHHPQSIPPHRTEFKAPLEYFFRNLESFLTEFGSDIWHTSIPLTGNYYADGYVDHYKGFQKCLGKMPSLKSLTVQFPISVLASNRICQARKLAKYLLVFPLPDMPNLKTLNLISPVSCYKLPFEEEVFVGLLTKYSKQIGSLYMHSRTFKRGIGWDFENLVDLILHDVDYDVPFKEAMSHLRVPRLEKLSITLGSSLPATTLKEIFEVCEPLPVKVLRIRSKPFPKTVYYKPKFYPNLEESLPIISNVKAFVLHHHFVGKLESFGFLKSLPMLDNLEIQILNEEPELNEVDLLEFSLEVGGNGEKMNVWELLPKLKIFVVGKKRFYRE